jgi:hypothetical protein
LTDLYEGTIYFAVNYIDGQMLIPVMETLVFIGRDLEQGDAGQVYFQDVTSYLQSVKYDWSTTDARASFYAGSENEIGHIFEYEHALNNLLWCLLRRQNTRQSSPMYFEGRELTPQAELINPSDLQEGEIYFVMDFVDDEMLTPVMETVVFASMNLAPNDEGQMYFQDVESYREGVRYETATEDSWATFKIVPANELARVFNFEGALEELMRCSLRRKRSPE